MIYTWCILYILIIGRVKIGDSILYDRIRVVLLFILLVWIYLYSKKRVLNRNYGLCWISGDKIKELPMYGFMLIFPMLNMAGNRINSFSWETLLCLGLMVLIACFEEFFFRGYLFWIISKKEGEKEKAAIVWSGVIFGILHCINFLGEKKLYVIIQIICSICIGICYGVVRAKTGSIIIPMFIHAINNVGAYIYTADDWMFIPYLIIGVLHIPYAFYLYNVDKY